MKNHKKFCELYSVPISYYKYFDYYVELLSQSEEWKSLRDDVLNFEKFEKEFQDSYVEIKNQKYKLISILEKYNFIFPKTSDKIQRINKNNTESNSLSLTSKFFISFDLIKANYQSLLYLDSSLPPQWELLCEENNINSIITNSKILRQEILGHFNPKAVSKIQNDVLLEFVKRNNLQNIVFLSTDEVIIEIEENDLLKVHDTFESKMINSFVFKYNNFDWKFKKSIFKYTNKGHKQFYKTNSITNNLSPTYLKLFKVPKKFYIYEFVREVLKEETYEIEKFFVEDGMLQKIIGPLDSLNHYLDENEI